MLGAAIASKNEEKVEKANKFEEGCRISTTISDLVIGGGLRPDVNKGKADKV